MKAVILAGGKGTRLYPVTLETPKPLLTVKRKPIINYVVNLLKTDLVSEVLVLVSREHEEDFLRWQERYTDVLPANLRLVFEEIPGGTFGGIKRIKQELTEPFLLLNGDNLYDFDLRQFIAFHQNHPQKPTGSLVLAEVDDARPFGVPVLEGDRIKTFLEKPEQPPSNFVSSGVYLLEPDVFNHAPEADFIVIEKDVFPKLASAGKLFAYKPQSYRWLACDTIEKWEHAIKHW